MLTLIYFILILGITVFVHEFGHFIFAKLAKIHVYEFSIGMGKRLFMFKRKNDETEYSIRLVPLGGYVRLAGEEVEEDKNIPKNRRLQDKTVLQRFLTMFAGPGFNFIFAFLLLLIIGLIFGTPNNKPIIAKINEGYPFHEAGILEGSTILEYNDITINNWDELSFEVQLNKEKTSTFKIKDSTGNIKDYEITPTKEIRDGEEVLVYGFEKNLNRSYGFLESIKYACEKTVSLFKTMFKTIGSLFTGGVSVSDLSGPVGIYSLVGDQAKHGIESILYLMAFLSINVGFINLIPLPAFDGGRILFLFIEKIKGSPISPKIENTIHNIGFILLMILMLYVTFNDVLRLF